MQEIGIDLAELPLRTVLDIEVFSFDMVITLGGFDPNNRLGWTFGGINALLSSGTAYQGRQFGFGCQLSHMRSCPSRSWLSTASARTHLDLVFPPAGRGSYYGATKA